MSNPAVFNPPRSNGHTVTPEERAAAAAKRNRPARVLCRSCKKRWKLFRDGLCSPCFERDRQMVMPFARGDEETQEKRRKDMRDMRRNAAL